MELEGLARRHAQRSIAVGAREFVEFQPLLRRADPARQAQPDQEGIGWLQLLAAALVAQIAVVLHIDAVELHQLGAVVAGDGAGDRVEQPLVDGSAQIVAARLHRLVGAELLERLREIAAAVRNRQALRHRLILSRRRADSDGRAAGCAHNPRPRPRARAMLPDDGNQGRMDIGRELRSVAADVDMGALLEPAETPRGHARRACAAHKSSCARSREKATSMRVRTLSLR